jgi:hypothetical protein
VELWEVNLIGSAECIYTHAYPMINDITNAGLNEKSTICKAPPGFVSPLEGSHSVREGRREYPRPCNRQFTPIHSKSENQ